MKADLTRLFVVDEAFARGSMRADFATTAENVDKWAAGECSDTIALKQHSGTKLGDLVGTTYSGFYLLSQRVLSVFDREGINGWRACAVTLKSSSRELIEGYSAVGITGRCGPLDNARSQKVTRILPESKSSTSSWIGLYFAEDSWDGSDLFRPQGTMLTIATGRVVDVLRAINATNVRIRPLLGVERAAL